MRGAILALWSLLAFVLWALHASACSSTQVEIQATTSTAIATAANETLPVIFGQGGVADRDLRARLTAACPAHDCARERVEQIRVQVEDRWRPVVPAYEAARAALTTWQTTLRQCHAAHDEVCLPGLALLGTLAAQVDPLRCALRAAGYDALDKLPLPPPVCHALDGGQVP